MLEKIVEVLLIIFIVFLLIGRIDGVWIPTYIESHGIFPTLERMWCGKNLCR